MVTRRKPAVNRGRAESAGGAPDKNYDPSTMNESTTMQQTKQTSRLDVKGAIRALISEWMNFPKDLTVSESVLGKTITLTIQCHGSDMARLMGSGGTTKGHIDAVCKLIGMRHGLAVRTTFLEPAVGERCKLPDFKGKTKWNSEPARRAVQGVLNLMLAHECKAEVFDGDKFESIIQVEVSPREDAEILAMIETRLGQLVKAIGMQQGRVASLVMIPTIARF